MNYRMMIAIILLICLSLPSLLYSLTAEEIMDRRDENEHIYSGRIESEMIIIKGSRETTKQMISYVSGEDGLTEFTNPRDRGTKYLKLGDELWMYFPDAEDLVRISGHMLRQGMMGSDFSYQDMMEWEKLTDLYNFDLVGEDTLDGRAVYVLEGIAKEGKDVSYYKRKVWIDKQRFIGIKEELYTRGGRLLKVAEVTEIEEFNGRWFPTEIVMNDQLIRDSRTIFRIKKLEFDYQIPEDKLSLEAMR
jgi:outer membrane lipoprotein-sorting protein